MKKLIALFAITGLMFALAACGGGATGSGSSSSEDASPQIPNPVVEYENTDFTEDAGFAVTAYPYTVVRSSLIGGTVAEITFETAPETTVVLRVGKDDGTEIHGIFSAIEKEEVLQVTAGTGTVDVTYFEYDEGAVYAVWKTGGFSYVLYIGAGTEDVNGIINTFVNDVKVEAAA